MMMKSMNYDPLQAPDPIEWNGRDEDERMAAVEDYHRRKHVPRDRLSAHATIHTVVENQIAMGDGSPAARAVTRLIAEGLDRHEAIHAIGSVLSRHMFNALKGHYPPNTDLGVLYNQEVEQLTAKSWLESAGGK